ncbi:hypothetical protein BCBBV1cgp8 [Bacillus phage BCASJ1c]|uniref:8 protein n=1 Tax=Bacillus phage BCASJ1c TaxID=294382 RepID=Q5YAA2_9CAUD|nr:hypothetical protein BCBBV1cgp8 [Bacillus phage BCASJ1c]AAU85055.1 8 [Bacillus phage BCASJ1c] [Bacillus phage BCASJ1c]
MTFGEMAGYTKRFHEIMQLDDQQLRSERLGNLMSDMEVRYQIPIFNKADFNQKNPHVFYLYRAVSQARSL